jgi:hypothetical protein
LDGDLEELERLDGDLKELEGLDVDGNSNFNSKSGGQNFRGARLLFMAKEHFAGNKKDVIEVTQELGIGYCEGLCLRNSLAKTNSTICCRPIASRRRRQWSSTIKSGGGLYEYSRRPAI